ncbi:MAG TPA: PilZ domain-containing protein [Kofleriaceae bacterium]|nr:PilZ domain-containing protein [Kofleriaceae bacterium]
MDLATSRPPLCELFIVLEPFRTGFNEFVTALEPLSHAAAEGPVLRGADVYYRPDTDVALLAVQLDEQSTTPQRLRWLASVAARADMPVLDPSRLGDVDRKEFYSDYLPTYRIRVEAAAHPRDGLEELARLLSLPGALPRPATSPPAGRASSPRGRTASSPPGRAAASPPPRAASSPRARPASSPPAARRRRAAASSVDPSPIAALLRSGRGTSDPADGPATPAARRASAPDGRYRAARGERIAVGPSAARYASAAARAAGVEVDRSLRSPTLPATPRAFGSGAKTAAPPSTAAEQPAAQKPAAAGKPAAAAPAGKPAAAAPAAARAAAAPAAQPAPGKPQSPAAPGRRAPSRPGTSPQVHVRFLRGDTWAPARLRSLNLRGARLAAAAPPRRGDRVQIVIGLDRLGAVVCGHVTQTTGASEAASTSEPVGFTVQFVDLTADTRAQLTSILRAAVDRGLSLRPPPARAAVRFPVRWPARIITSWGEVGADTLDVSRGGLFLVPNAPLGEKELLFQLPLDQSGPPLSGRAAIAREVSDEMASERGLPRGYGVRILDFSRDDGARYDAFLDRVRRRTEMRLVIAAESSRAHDLSQGLGGAGYSVQSSSDPRTLLGRLASGSRPPDAALLHAPLLERDPTAHALKRSLHARQVPCLTVGDEPPSRARQVVDHLLRIS